MRLGMTELIVIFVVALFVIGPDRLPAYAKKLGEALAQFKKYSDAATKDIKESIVQPLEEAQRPLKEAVEPIAELDKAVRDNVKEVQNSFNNIGKPQKKKAVKEEKSEADTGESKEAAGADDNSAAEAADADSKAKEAAVEASENKDTGSAVSEEDTAGQQKAAEAKDETAEPPITDTVSGDANPAVPEDII